MATLTSPPSLHLKTLIPSSMSSPRPLAPLSFISPLHRNPFTSLSLMKQQPAMEASSRSIVKVMAVNRKNRSSSISIDETTETIMLPGSDFNHWLIVMEFPEDPAPTREQMIETYLNTLATVLGSMEEAKKNMYALSTTTYTGFQCTVSQETSEKFKGLPGVIWVLPDSYLDVKNKDYGGDKYVNGEIIPCKYPTYQPKQRRSSKYESRRYERRRDDLPPERKKDKPSSSSN